MSERRAPVATTVRTLAGCIAVLLACSTAAAQAPMPVEVPATVRSPERERLASRREALLADREALRSEASRHNDACSAVTEGSAADAACIAAQQRLTARIAAYRGAVDGFNAVVTGAPRAATIVAPTPRPTGRPPVNRTSTETRAPVADAARLDAGADVYFDGVSGTGDYAVVTPGGERLSAEQARRRRLETGTRITTGADGTAEITLPDGARFMVGPNSQIVLALEGTSAQSIYDVVTGTLRAISARLRDGAHSPRWRVRTVHAVAGVRGTDFQATVQPTGSGSWRVSEGAIELRTPEGRALALLNAGQTLTWDDSLRITSLQTATAAMAVGSDSATRTRIAEKDLADWAREYGQLAAVVLLLGLITIHFATSRRRTG